MRSPAAFFLLAVAFCSVGFSAFAAESRVRLIRIWPGYRTAESFERISEYFNNRENPGRQTILRTQPSARAGYYFLVRLDNPAAAPTEATFELQVIAPSSPETRRYTFSSRLPPGSHVFNLGLTGSDWVEKAQPVAWLIVIRGADGTELARQQSFLWAKPPQA